MTHTTSIVVAVGMLVGALAAPAQRRLFSITSACNVTTCTPYYSVPAVLVTTGPGAFFGYTGQFYSTSANTPTSALSGLSCFDSNDASRVPDLDSALYLFAEAAASGAAYSIPADGIAFNSGLVCTIRIQYCYPLNCQERGGTSTAIGYFSTSRGAAADHLAFAVAPTGDGRTDRP